MNRPLLFATCLLPALSTATQKTDLKAMFQARYDEYVRAYAARDISAVSKILAPGYTSGDYLHKVDKAHELDNLKHSDGKFKTVSRTVLSVTLNRNKASVLEDSVTKGKMREPGKPGDHKFEIRMRCLDTWEKIGGAWCLKHVRALKTATLEDGHPFKPGKKGAS